MKYSQDFIEKVRDASNIEEVISRHTQLNKKGGRLFARCPYPDHNEKTPSFSVSPEKQVYYCFGCKQSGNVFTFLRDIDGLSFPEAVEWLANRAGIALPEPDEFHGEDKEYRQQKRRQKSLNEINKVAAEYYQAQLRGLNANHPYRQYIANRNLTEDLIQGFGLGVSTEDWQGLVNHLTHKGCSLQDAEHLGLIRKRKDGKGFFDLYRSRLMFPIVSLSGHTLGFGARTFTDENPKYLNSPESDVFHKGKTFYGLNETAKYLRSLDEAIVVEGYMDLLALYEAGIQNVVASLGTALTDQHARGLVRYTKKGLTLFDGDRAGFTAAERSLAVFLKHGLRPRMLALPEGLDPDSFLQKYGVDLLREQIANAPDLFSYLLSEDLKTFKGQSSEKVRLFERHYAFLKEAQDRGLKALYLQELSEKLTISKEWVRQYLKNGGAISGARSMTRVGAAQTAPKKAESGDGDGRPGAGDLTQDEALGVKTEEVIKLNDPPRAELNLLNLALMREQYFKIIEENEIHAQFSDLGLRKTFSKASELYRQMPNKFDSLTALLVSAVQPSEMITRYMGPPLSEMDEKETEKLFEDCRLKVKEQYLQELSAQLQGRLHKVSSVEESQEILEQIMNIQRQRHGLKAKNNQGVEI